MSMDRTAAIRMAEEWLAIGPDDEGYVEVDHKTLHLVNVLTSQLAIADYRLDAAMRVLKGERL